MNQHTRIRQTSNLLAYRPEMVSRAKTDLELVEAIHIAAERAILAAGRGVLRSSPAGHALINAIFELTGADEDYQIALEWGSQAGVVKTEDL